MTISRLIGTFQNTSGVMINSNYSGYNSRIIENAAKTNSSKKASTGLTARRTTTRTRISSPIPPPPPPPSSTIMLPTETVARITSPVPVTQTAAPTQPLSVDVEDIIEPPEPVQMVYSAPPLRLAPIAEEDEREFFSDVASEPVNFLQNPNDESFSGPALTEDEKPKIVAITSVDVINGRSSKNVIFFKGLLSFDKKPVKYVLSRKDLFNDAVLTAIATITPSELVLSTNFPDLINPESSEAKSTFALVDNDLAQNRVYIYKLYVEWVEKTAEEKLLFLAPIQNTEILGDLFIV